MNETATFILIVVILVSISISYFADQRNDQYVVPILPQSTLFDRIELEQEKRRRILKRGCRVAGDLDRMSKNGTSFETLIAFHRRIHNLRKCPIALHYFAHKSVPKFAILSKRTTMAPRKHMPRGNIARRSDVWYLRNEGDKTNTRSHILPPTKMVTGH